MKEWRWSIFRKPLLKSDRAVMRQKHPKKKEQDVREASRPVFSITKTSLSLPFEQQPLNPAPRCRRQIFHSIPYRS